MNKLLNTMLRCSISASMSDRDAFIERIAQVIEQKVGTDSQTAQQIGDTIAVAMESIDEQLLIDQLLNPQPDSNKDLEKRLDRLTEAIEKLNANIEKLQK